MEQQFKSFVLGYMATAEWSMPEPEEEEWAANGWSIAAIKIAIADCREFIRRVRVEFPPEDAERILWRGGIDLTYVCPHDFSLTRNRHGAGFWDRPWHTKEEGEHLTRICHDMKEADLYIGDDSKLYFQ